MNRRFEWPAYGFVALLIGFVAFGFGLVGTAAQEATPVTDVTPVPDPTASAEANDPPTKPVGASGLGQAPPAPGSSPESRIQHAQLVPAASPEARIQEAQLIEAQQAGGTATITVLDENSNPLPGACFVVYLNSGTDELGPAVADLCDGRDDAAADGVLTFTLPPGRYILVETVAPEGYVSGDRTSFTLGGGGQFTYTVVNDRGGRVVLISKKDQGGNLLGGACFTIFEDAGDGEPGDVVSTSCDGPDGGAGDGLTSFQGIATGFYVAVETRVPSGYAATGTTLFTVTDSSTGPMNVDVVNRPVESPGNLVVNKVDENGTRLAGACFSVHDYAGGGQRGDVIMQRCDSQDGQDDGQLVFTGLSPGNYVLVETHAPAGYLNGAQRLVTVRNNAPTIATMRNEQGGSNVTVRKVDADDEDLLSGACFVLHQDSGSGGVTPGSALEERCDVADGVLDGLTQFTGVPAGDYFLVETVAPEDYSANIGLVRFSVDGFSSETVTVENAETELIEMIVQILIEVINTALEEQGG